MANAAPSGHINYFTVIGTNFTKADTKTRSRFAITRSQVEHVYQKAAETGLSDFLILSTCNRTEFYGVGSIQALKSLVAEQLQLSEMELTRYFYRYSGEKAVEQFFRVVSGLDSQIIGDYEIVCQVKAALEDGRRYKLVGTLTDRVANFAFQASKKVKAHTNLSSGKYSVSYAAAELLYDEQRTQPIENILLVGTGDFGSTVARNLRHYFPKTKLTLTNRTQEKATILASQVNAAVIPFDTFLNQLEGFDALITTVGLEQYLIHPEHLKGDHNKILLDLSIPQSVNPEAKNLPGIKLFSVDEVSAFHNELINQRKLEIPRAERIVDLFIGRFMEWHQVYSHRHLIQDYKEKLKNLITDDLAADTREALVLNKKIEKTFSGLIQQIKMQGYAGCSMIEAVNKLVPAAQ